MNKVLNLNVNQAKSFLNEADYENVKKEIVEAHKLLRAQTGPGNDFLGWLNLPVDIDLEVGESIKIISGPLRDSVATIQEIVLDKRKIKALVDMFGRETLAELDFNQIEKLV